jgi:hypothetical protein
VSLGRCRSCGAEVIWSPVAATGSLMPLDVQTELAPEPKLVAFNPETQVCRVLKRSDLRDAEQWMSHGVTIHRSHYATCPDAERWRRPVERP